MLLGTSFWYADRVAKEANEGVVVEAHIKGNPDAAVELVEYSDFQCPACAQAYPQVVSLLEEYGDQLRFEYRHFPLITIHAHAVPAAKAAEAAGQQGQFWGMHDLLFENQSQWSRSNNPEAFFKQYAAELGLDLALFERHLNASVINDAITESFEEARERGLSGTPTFFLNGERMELSSFEDFRNQIEGAILAADESTES